MDIRIVFKTLKNASKLHKELRKHSQSEHSLLQLGD